MTACARNGYSKPGTGLCMMKRCSAHSKKEAMTAPAEKPRADQNNRFISINKFLTSLLAVRQIEKPNMPQQPALGQLFFCYRRVTLIFTRSGMIQPGADAGLG